MQLFLRIFRALRNSLRSISPLYNRSIHVQQEDGHNGCGPRFPGASNNRIRRSDNIILLSNLRPRPTREGSNGYARELYEQADKGTNLK